MNGHPDLRAETLGLLDQIAQWVPAIGTGLRDALIGEIPEVDEWTMFELADRLGQLADAFERAVPRFLPDVDRLAQNWEGGTRDDFLSDWRTFTKDRDELVASARSMQGAVQAFGAEVELQRYLVYLDVLLIAAAIVHMLYLAFFTGGGALVGAGALIVARLAAIRSLTLRTINNIMSLEVRRALTQLSSRAGLAAAGRATLAAGRTAAGSTASSIGAGLEASMVAIGVAARRAPSNLVRNLMPSSVIARSVGNHMAARWARQMAVKNLPPELRRLQGSSLATLQRHLAVEIEKRLLTRWGAERAVGWAERATAGTLGRLSGRTAVDDATRAALTRYAESYARTSSFWSQLGQYVGTRMAMGAGILGSGNLGIQAVQEAVGHRREIDFSSVATNTVQGGVMGAAMWGGLTGHALGGGGANVLFGMYELTDDHAGPGEENALRFLGNRFAQGMAMGLFEGVQNHTFTPGRLHFGQEVQALTTADGGLATLMTDHAAAASIRVGDPGVATWTDADVVSDIPPELAPRGRAPATETPMGTPDGTAPPGAAPLPGGPPGGTPPLVDPLRHEAARHGAQAAVNEALFVRDAGADVGDPRVADRVARAEELRQRVAQAHAAVEGLARHPGQPDPVAAAEAVRALEQSTADLRAATADIHSAIARVDAEHRLHVLFGNDSTAAAAAQAAKLASWLSTGDLAASVEPTHWRMEFQPRMAGQQPFAMVAQLAAEIDPTAPEVRFSTATERAGQAIPVFDVRVPQAVTTDPGQVIGYLERARAAIHTDLNGSPIDRTTPVPGRPLPSPPRALRPGPNGDGPIRLNRLDERALREIDELARAVEAAPDRPQPRERLVGRMADLGLLGTDADAHARWRAAASYLTGTLRTPTVRLEELRHTPAPTRPLPDAIVGALQRLAGDGIIGRGSGMIEFERVGATPRLRFTAGERAIVAVEVGFQHPGHATFTPLSAHRPHTLELAPDLLGDPARLATVLQAILGQTRHTRATFADGPFTIGPDGSVRDALRDPLPGDRWLRRLRDAVTARDPQAAVYLDRLVDGGTLPDLDTLDAIAVAPERRADVIVRMWHETQAMATRASDRLAAMEPALRRLGVPPEALDQLSHGSALDPEWMALARAIDERPLIQVPEGSAVDAHRVTAATLATVVQEIHRADPGAGVTKYVEPLRLARRLVEAAIEQRLAHGRPIFADPAPEPHARPQPAAPDPQPLHEDVRAAALGGLRTAGLLGTPALEILRPGDHAATILDQVERALPAADHSDVADVDGLRGLGREVASLARRTDEAVGALVTRQLNRIDLAEAARAEAQAAPQPRAAADTWGRPDALAAARRTQERIEAMHRLHASQYERAALLASQARDRYQALAAALDRLASPDSSLRTQSGPVLDARARLAEARDADAAYRAQLALTRPPEELLTIGVPGGPLPGVPELARAITHMLDQHGVDYAAARDNLAAPDGISVVALAQNLRAELRELNADGVVLQFGRAHPAEVQVRLQFGEPVEVVGTQVRYSEGILGQMPQAYIGPVEQGATVAWRGGVSAGVSREVLFGPAASSWLTEPTVSGSRRTSQAAGGGIHAQTGNVLDIRKHGVPWDVPVLGWDVTIRAPEPASPSPAGRPPTQTRVPVAPDRTVRLWLPASTTGPVPEVTSRRPPTGPFPEGVTVHLRGIRDATDAARELVDAQAGSYPAQTIEASFSELPALFAPAVNHGLVHDITDERGARIGQLTSTIRPALADATLLSASEGVLWTETLRLGFLPMREGADATMTAAVGGGVDLGFTVGGSVSRSSRVALNADNTTISVGVQRFSGDLLVYRLPYEQTIRFQRFEDPLGHAVSREVDAQTRVVRGEALLVLTAPDAHRQGLPVPDQMLRDVTGDSAGTRVPRDDPDPRRHPAGRMAQPPPFAVSGHGVGPGQARNLTGLTELGAVVDQLRQVLTDGNGQRGSERIDGGYLPQIGNDGLPRWDPDPHVRAQQMNTWQMLHQLTPHQVETLYNLAVQTGIPLTVTRISGLSPAAHLTTLRIGTKGGREMLLVVEPAWAEARYLGLTEATEQVNLPISSGTALQTSAASWTWGGRIAADAGSDLGDGSGVVTRGGQGTYSRTREVAFVDGNVINQVGLHELGRPMAVWEVPHRVRVVWADTREMVAGAGGRPIEARGSARLAWATDLLPRPAAEHPTPTAALAEPGTTSLEVIRDAHIVSVLTGRPGEILAAGRAVLPDASRPGTPAFTKLATLLNPDSLAANLRDMLMGAQWDGRMVTPTSVGELGIRATVGESVFVSDVKNFILGRIRFAMMPEATIASQSNDTGVGVSIGATVMERPGQVGAAEVAGQQPTELFGGRGGVGGAYTTGVSEVVGRIAGRESLLVDVGDAFLMRAPMVLELSGVEQTRDMVGSADSPVHRSRRVEGEVVYAVPVRLAIEHYVQGRLALPLDQAAALVASYATGHRDLPRRDALALLDRYRADYAAAREADPRLPADRPELPDETFTTPDGVHERLAQRLREELPDVAVPAEVTEASAVVAHMIDTWRGMNEGPGLPAVPPGTPDRLPPHLRNSVLNDLEQVQTITGDTTGSVERVGEVVQELIDRVAPGALDKLTARDSRAALANMLAGDRWLGFIELMRRDDGWVLPLSGQDVRVRLRLVDEQVGEYLGRTSDVGSISQRYRYNEVVYAVSSGSRATIGASGAAATVLSSGVGVTPAHGESSRVQGQSTRIARLASFNGFDRLRTSFTVQVEVTRVDPLRAAAGMAATATESIHFQAISLVPADMLAADVPQSVVPAVDPRPMPVTPHHIVIDHADSAALRAAVATGLGRMLMPATTPDPVARRIGELVIDFNARRADQFDDPARSAGLVDELAGRSVVTTLEIPGPLPLVPGVGRYVEVAAEAFVTAIHPRVDWPAQAYEVGRVERSLRMGWLTTNRTEFRPLALSFGLKVPGVGGVTGEARAPSGSGASRGSGTRSETTVNLQGQAVSGVWEVQYRLTLVNYDVYSGTRSVIVRGEQQLLTPPARVQATVLAEHYQQMLADAERADVPPGPFLPDATEREAAVARARRADQDRALHRFTFADLLAQVRQDRAATPGQYHQSMARIIDAEPRLGRRAPVWITAEPTRYGQRVPDPVTFARLLSRDLDRQVVLELPQSAQHGPRRMLLTAVRGDLIAVEGADAGFIDAVKRLPSEYLARLTLPELGRVYESVGPAGLADAVRRQLAPHPLPPGAAGMAALTVVGDPASHTPPVGGATWSVAELGERLRVVHADSGRRTLWLATEADYLDVELRTIVSRAAVPEGYVGVVAAGRGGRVWLDGRWVEPGDLAQAVHRTLGGPQPVALIIPEALDGLDPFAARFFEANGGRAVIATGDYVLIDRFRGTVIAAPIGGGSPRIDRAGPAGEFFNILDVRYQDPTARDRIDSIGLGHAGTTFPPDAASVHIGDYVSLVEVPLAGGGRRPGHLPTIGAPSAPPVSGSGAWLGPVDPGTPDMVWAEEAYHRFRNDPTDIGEIAANLAGLWRPAARAGLTPEDLALLDRLAGDDTPGAEEAVAARLRKAVAQIKQHLFEDRHLIPGRLVPRRFVPNADIAEAWIRLREGRWYDEWTDERHALLSADLLLLVHEIEERTYLRTHPGATYEQAHAWATDQGYDWQERGPRPTGEDLDNLWPTSRDYYGDNSRLPEGVGGRRPGGVLVRSSAGAGATPGDRQADPAGGSSGREPGRPVPGGAAGDSPLAGPPGWVAGAGDGGGLTRQPAWRPDNQVEQALAQAVTDGDSQRYFQVLSTATLCLPRHRGDPPDQPRLLTIQLSGQPFLAVFTSPAALANALGTVVDGYAVTDYTTLREQWPMPQWRLAVNPGTPIDAYVDINAVAAAATGTITIPLAMEAIAEEMAREDRQPPPPGATPLLRSAAQQHDAATYIAALIDSVLTVPTARDVTDPAELFEPTFPWVRRGDPPVIDVFTSVEEYRRHAGRAGPALTAAAWHVFMAWPPGCSLSLDPGGEHGIELAEDEVRILAAWSDAPAP